MSGKPGVTICGCGSGGMAMAADLAVMGCRVKLYETPAFAANLDPIRANGGITLTGLVSGKTGLARLDAITSGATETLAGSELVFINLRAMAVGLYSFIPMEELARVVNLTTPVTTAMTDLTAVFTGYDYRGNGLTLEKLGLTGMDRDRIIAFAEAGC